jgi:hypothetical protein
MKTRFFAHIVLVFCLIASGLALDSAAGQSGSKKVKKHRIHRKVRRLAPVDTTIERADVIDTCAFDTLTELQRRFLSEVNRWGTVRYHRGGMTKLGVDCSGFTCRIYQDAVSVVLPRTSGEQSKIGEKVDRHELSFGDLLFFLSKSKRKRINHVGIYLADGRFVHSSRSHGVRIDSLTESYYARHFATARRVITESDDDDSDSLSGSR